MVKSGGIDYSDFTIRISEKDMMQSPNALISAIKDFDTEAARIKMKQVRKMFVYTMAEDWIDGAFGMIMKQLEQKVEGRLLQNIEFLITFPVYLLP